MTYISRLFTLTALLFFGFCSSSLWAQSSVKVFVLAGQSNMQGQGSIYAGANGAIGITVATFTPFCDSSETCDFTFDMVDSYGDGWNGWVYDFVQNGVVVATETLASGFAGTSTITLESDVVCDVVINTAGAYGNEISWTMIHSSGAEVAMLAGQTDDYPSPNTLTDVMENDTDGLWSMLESDGSWTVVDNAYLYFVNGQGTLIRDNVTIAQGANPERIGPELMFAHQMAAYYDDPVLIIKAAWGGLSLAADFRPPSAGGTTGAYYTEMIGMVENVTQNIATEFPMIGSSAFEIAGFAWFQGWNDGGSDDFLNEYESNLHHLVNDVRSDLGSPNLPFVIASSGQGGYEDHWGWTENIQEIISVAQENIGCDDLLYGGSVGFVNTKPFYMAVSESPDDAGYHYHNNALSFLNIGKSIGDEMILAINDIAFCTDVLSVDGEDGSDMGISIYPSPVATHLTVDLGKLNGLNTAIELYDSSSRLIIHERCASTRMIDVSSLPAGIYTLRLTGRGHDFRAIRRIVKR